MDKFSKYFLNSVLVLSVVILGVYFYQGSGTSEVPPPPPQGVTIEAREEGFERAMDKAIVVSLMGRIQSLDADAKSLEFIDETTQEGGALERKILVEAATLIVKESAPAAQHIKAMFGDLQSGQYVSILIDEKDAENVQSAVARQIVIYEFLAPPAQE